MLPCYGSHSYLECLASRRRSKSLALQAPLRTQRFYALVTFSWLVALGRTCLFHTVSSMLLPNAWPQDVSMEAMWPLMASQSPRVHASLRTEWLAGRMLSYGGSSSHTCCDKWCDTIGEQPGVGAATCSRHGIMQLGSTCCMPTAGACCHHQALHRAPSAAAGLQRTAPHPGMVCCWQVLAAPPIRLMYGRCVVQTSSCSFSSICQYSEVLQQCASVLTAAAHQHSLSTSTTASVQQRSTAPAANIRSGIPTFYFWQQRNAYSRATGTVPAAAASGSPSLC
jgi:hypothetical protein